jgi:uncharacterized cofD-like protein
MPDNAPNIVVIGGGTGTFTLLQELKELTPNISAIVNMSDDGGSSGVLRDELGVLPPGDIRQCLVALSDTNDIRELFNYRFADGRFEGQSLGNIILSGLELQHGSFDQAIKIASEILHITGHVIPVTLDKHTLAMIDGSETIHGEFNIGHRHINNRGAEIRHQPASTINPDAKTAIAGADLIVIAPGNVYGSLLPIFAVDGFAEAMQKTPAKKVSVTNLVTKPGQTDGWHVVDFIKEFEKYLGENQIDTVLYNNTPISKYLLNKYADSGEFPVDIAEDRFKEIQASSIGSRLVSPDISVQDPNDSLLKRTLIRHDGKQVGEELMRILN